MTRDSTQLGLRSSFDDQNRGLLATPRYSVRLPGSRLASNTISSIVIQPLNIYSLIACTDAGILAVTLSPAASHISVLFTLVDEPALAIDTQITDVQVDWHRTYIQYYKDALAVSYDTRQHIVQPITVAAESCRRVMITNEEYLSMMDESSGRVVMQKSESLLTVYYYSLYDVNK
ncbi:hypothetical protein FIBSPDRAFT_886933 [Athelia psychrophila]|uniref:Uncharacterized protein n=1 Tax=Athelia psychrophila TaxID=1759441 RepID=A0A166QE85_9AGAM|nr:hypothetical protein FIBSPDRAFT_886933 [Fibularhizoctonia sp. CBS 109695]